MNRTLLAATVAAMALSSPLATAEERSGTMPINGLEMYYEIHGEGEPLVLLHGAYMSIPSNWEALIPTLAEQHKVIAVELQGHARTTDRDTPISYDGMAEDVTALLDQLGIEKAALFGYSMGGAVAIRVAMLHPERVSRLVAASAGYIYNEEVMGPDFMQMVDSITPEMFANTPFEAEYKRLAPHPENFPVLVEKLKQLDLDSVRLVGRVREDRGALALHLRRRRHRRPRLYREAPPGGGRRGQRRHGGPAQDAAAGPPRHQPHRRVLQPAERRDHEDRGAGVPQAATPRPAADAVMVPCGEGCATLRFLHRVIPAKAGTFVCGVEGKQRFPLSRE